MVENLSKEVCDKNYTEFSTGKVKKSVLTLCTDICYNHVKSDIK